MTYKEKKQNYIDDANKTLRNHVYTLLTKKNGCEVWECRKASGSSVYAFIIALLPMGIAVVGDIGSLTFEVNRPIGFLAGRDVEYYIHSKLCHENRETEYDTDGIKDSVLETIKDTLEDSEKIFEIFSKDEHIQLNQNVESLNFKELHDYIKTVYKEMDISHKAYDFIDSLQEFLGDVNSLDNERDAYELLDRCEVVEFNDCFEYSFMKPSESLIRRLYLVNQASVAICKQIENENTRKYISDMGIRG